MNMLAQLALEDHHMVSGSWSFCLVGEGCEQSLPPEAGTL
jgi:hypothetical protein